VATPVLREPLALLNDHAHWRRRPQPTHWNSSTAGQLVRKGRGTEELVDRLMISSPIEARSCQRFRLLGDAVEDDRELEKLYRELWASEHGHYLSFIQLAEHLLPADVVEKRWSQMLDSEAKIIRSREPGPGCTADFKSRTITVTWASRPCRRR
jgi:tRNA-(ms[2]io[6]A)-hydroxylase